MSDDHNHVDELGRRAAAAVRERAELVARRSDREPREVRRLRPGSKRLMAVAAAFAVTAGAAAFVAMALDNRPPAVSVQPVAPPSGEVDQPRPRESADPDLSPVPELLDSGTQSAWYMTADGYHEGVEGRHDEVCTWAREQIPPGQPVPAHIDGSAHRSLHDAINEHLAYPADGLPIVVGSVCGLLVWSPDTWFSGFEPQWWDSPPYPWQQEGPAPAPDVDDLLKDLLTEPAADASERFRDERLFAEQADRIGGPDVLCRWFQARIPKDVFQEVGVTWETAASQFRDAVLRWLPADAPDLGETLSYACGYLDPYVAEQDGRWWVDPPYLWGRWLLSPPMQYQIAGHSDYEPLS